MQNKKMVKKNNKIEKWAYIFHNPSKIMKLVLIIDRTPSKTEGCLLSKFKMITVSVENFKG